MGQTTSPYFACAAFAAGGLITTFLTTALTATPSLPDVQVSDIGLTANPSSGQDSMIGDFQNFVQQAFGDSAEPAQRDLGLDVPSIDHLNGDLTGTAGPNLSLNDLELDQNTLNSLIGSGFDTDAVRDSIVIDPGVPTLPGVPAFDGSAAGGLFGGNTQNAATAASAAAGSVAAMAAGLPALQQAVDTGILAMESQFNSALIDAQAAATGHLSDSSSVVQELVNAMYIANDSIVAQDEASLNSLLGLGAAPDIHEGLLSAVGAAAGSQVDWANLTGITPEDVAAIINAVGANNFFALLGDMDWSGIFSNMF